MHIHFHGASVTAQAPQGGYFGHLVELWAILEGRPVSFSRSAFGASHFDAAGYHFLTDVLDAQPDVCILEWTTTSAKAFDPERSDALSHHLVSHAITPVWLTLPRMDDPFGTRQTVLDARASAARWRAPLLDIAATLTGGDRLAPLLRDVVHTTELGGRTYAALIAAGLQALGVDDIDSPNAQVAECIAGASDHAPLPIPKTYRIGDQADLPAYIDNVWEHRFICSAGVIELLVEGLIGPHSPIIDTEVLNCAGTQVCLQTHCIFDPWCYYERRMSSTILRTTLPAGSYTVRIHVRAEDPSAAVTLRQPLKAPHNGSRQLRIDRFSSLNMTFTA